MTTMTVASKPQSLELYKKIKEAKFKRVHNQIETAYATERKRLLSPEDDEFLPERVRSKKNRVHLVISST